MTWVNAPDAAPDFAPEPELEPALVLESAAAFEAPEPCPVEAVVFGLFWDGDFLAPGEVPQAAAISALSSRIIRRVDGSVVNIAQTIELFAKNCMTYLPYPRHRHDERPLQADTQHL